MKCSGMVTAQRQRTTMCTVHGLVGTVLKSGLLTKILGLRIWPWSKVGHALYTNVASNLFYEEGNSVNHFGNNLYHRMGTNCENFGT